MDEFDYGGVHAAANTGYFGSSPPPYGLNPPTYSEVSPPYPTQIQSDVAIGYQSNYPSCPQGPPPMPHLQSPPYPVKSQLPCVPPQYCNYPKVMSTQSMTIQNINATAPPPIVPSFDKQQTLMSPYVVTQQSLTPYVVTQQSLTPYVVTQQSLTPYVVTQQSSAPYVVTQKLPRSSTLMMQSSSCVTASHTSSSYQTINNIQKPSKSLSREIAGAILSKVTEHVMTPKPKYKNNQVTIINGGSSLIIHK